MTDALDDRSAVRVLALVVDHAGHLDPGLLRAVDQQLREAAADTAPGPGGLTAGDLARETLDYLSAQPDRAQVVSQAAAMPPDTTRLDPATLGIGALVVLALQTEFDLSRAENGRWRLRVHKKAMRDSTLVQLVGKLLDFYRPPTP